MKRKSAESLFKPPVPRGENRQDATSRAAWAIIAGDAAKTAAKTERLRAARLAQEEQAPPVLPKAPRRRRAT